VKKNKDTYGIYPTKFASSTQKHKKINETPNRNKKKSQIKVCLDFKSDKKAKIRTRRSLQAQPKIPKKLSEHQIYQSGQKN
jgi:hypothetical protein